MPILAKYTEGEDIVDFLQAFKRAMLLHRVPEEEWPENLHRVTGKARVAFTGADPWSDYANIKEVILERFEVSREASGIQFREAKYDPQEDPGLSSGKVANTGQEMG